MNIDAARENARKADGKFGTQVRDESPAQVTPAAINVGAATWNAHRVHTDWMDSMEALNIIEQVTDDLSYEDVDSDDISYFVVDRSFDDDGDHCSEVTAYAADGTELGCMTAGSYMRDDVAVLHPQAGEPGSNVEKKRGRQVLSVRRSVEHDWNAAFDSYRHRMIDALNGR